MHPPTSLTPPTTTSRRVFLQQSAAAVSIAAATHLAGTAARAAQAVAPGTNVVPIRSIHPYPNKIAWGQGVLALGPRVNLQLGSAVDPAHQRMLNETWQQFTFGAVTLEVTRDRTLEGAQFRLTTAARQTALPTREAAATYALRVDDAGAAASAKDPVALRHAWFTLLQLLQATDSGTADQPGFTLAHVEIQDWPRLTFRGIHLCVFKETPPLMVEKAIRLAAFLKYSHVVLEFWGMLKLDALKELSWPEAWTKADAGRFVTMARDLGLEVIPMFNCWGHGAASRISYGRHVVLDQNPRLAPLFEPDGWTWCLTHPRARDLLLRVCDELSEFAGPGRYFHIGCDEAYSHASCDRCRTTDRIKLFTEHLNRLDAHLEKRGRRTLMWGDALLERAKWPRPLAANGTPALPTHESIQGLSRRIVIADWHYDVNSGDLVTLGYFRDQGFATIACPWNTPANIRTLANAAVKHRSEGLLLTTWHHLVQTMPRLPYVAATTWCADQAVFDLRQMDSELLRATTAAYLRKLVPANGQFDRGGWNPFEMPAETH
jgi:hypothetical protein